MIFSPGGTIHVLFRDGQIANPSYISYQRVCCYFSVIPATSGSGFSEPSGSSQLVAAQPPYISYQRICCYSNAMPATNGSGLSQTERQLALAAALPPYEV